MARASCEAAQSPLTTTGTRPLRRPRGPPPVGAPLVELAARASVHRYHRDAGRLRARGEFGGVVARCRPSRGASSASPARRPRQRPPRRCAMRESRSRISALPARRAGDALGRAAHVDVDDRSARHARPAAPLRHRRRIAADELHDMGRTPSPSARRRFRRRQRGSVASHHFGDDERCAEPSGDAPHADVGDARHRRQHDAAVEQQET